MKRAHFISGLTITLFTGLHLLNHLISIFGIEAHIDCMDTLRLFYRNRIGESILLIAVLLQIISGLRLVFRKRRTTSSFFEKLQLWTGLYLAFFLVIHVGAVLTGRYMLGLDTNFYFGVAGLNTFPFNLFFIPYYALAIISFFGHISAIHALKMKSSILGMNPIKQSYMILIFGLVLTLIIFYGLTNGFNGVEIPREYGIIPNVLLND